jgi:hypothetical protein
MQMLSVIRARLKDKVGSLRSAKRWFALHSIGVLNKYERATNLRFPFTNHAGARTECLTLMHNSCITIEPEACGW